jgi:hypothetical protein
MSLNAVFLIFSSKKVSWMGLFGARRHVIISMIGVDNFLWTGGHKHVKDILTHELWSIWASLRLTTLSFNIYLWMKREDAHCAITKPQNFEDPSVRIFPTGNLSIILHSRDLTNILKLLIPARARFAHMTVVNRQCEWYSSSLSPFRGRRFIRTVRPIVFSGEPRWTRPRTLGGLHPCADSEETDHIRRVGKHVQFTNIYSSSKLRFVFSEAKVCVSFPTPSRPCPHLLCIKWNDYRFFSFNWDC